MSHAPQASALAFFVTSAGLVYSCGDGSSSTLGHGDLDDRATPQCIEALQPHVITQAPSPLQGAQC